MACIALLTELLADDIAATLADTEAVDIISWYYRGYSWGVVGCFGFNGPLRQYFSLYRAISQTEEKEERKDRG